MKFNKNKRVSKNTVKRSVRKEVILVEKAGVVGAGVMGPGIGLALADAGYDVLIMDLDQKALERGLKDIKNTLDLFLEEGTVSKKQAKNSLSRIELTTDIDDLRDVDYVTEAVTENMKAKKEVFSELDEVCGEEVILASNTSSLDINEIASVTNRPDKVIVTHWMNPPSIIPIVEVVMGRETSQETKGFVMNLLDEVGKAPVLLKKIVPGYLINRMNFAIAREALSMIEKDIVEKEDVDVLFKKAFGPRYTLMGPIQTLDLFGLDTCKAIAEYIYPSLSNAETPSELLEEKVNQGKLGVKSGKGFYQYGKESPDKIKSKIDKRILERLKLINSGE